MDKLLDKLMTVSNLYVKLVCVATSHMLLWRQDSAMDINMDIQTWFKTLKAGLHLGDASKKRTLAVA